jgi:hypothetical protein
MLSPEVEHTDVCISASDGKLVWVNWVDAQPFCLDREAMVIGLATARRLDRRIGRADTNADRRGAGAEGPAMKGGRCRGGG